MKSYKLIASLVLLATLFINFSISIYAKNLHSNNTLANIENTSVDMVLKSNNNPQIISVKDLYNKNDIAIAKCINLKNGYIICDTSYNVVEYSFENNLDFLSNNNKIYYGGPLNYYT